MNTQVSIVTRAATDVFGGKANPSRGENYRAHAVMFGKAHPVGSDPIQMGAFDAFIIEHMGVIPPASLDRSSDGWLAFLQRRQIAKQNLNRAAAHPRMRDHGMAPYYISVFGHGMLRVLPAVEAIASDNSANKIQSLVVSRKRRVDYLLQSVDFGELPPSMQIKAALLDKAMRYYIKDQETAADRLNEAYEELRGGVTALIASNSVTPTNGGIAAIIDETNDDTDDDADDESADGDSLTARKDGINQPEK